jgi:Spy/CpxP family protein refolding chaperone
MKKIIVTAFALAVATLVTQAQEKPEGRHERHGRHGARHHKEFFQKLNLSEEQKSKFKALNESYHKQMQDLKKKDDITVKDWKGQKKSLREDLKAKVQGLLTSEQKAQMQKMRQERGEKRKEASEERMQRMKTRLGLSDDQVTKLKAERSGIGEKMKAIRENKSLSDEQKKEQFKQLREKQKESMKTILTDEQMKKLKEGKHKRSPKQTV